MKKKIIDVSSENKGMTIRAINGIFLLQESWMTDKNQGTRKGANLEKKDLLKTIVTKGNNTKN